MVDFIIHMIFFVSIRVSRTAKYPPMQTHGWVEATNARDAKEIFIRYERLETEATYTPTDPACETYDWNTVAVVTKESFSKEEVYNGGSDIDTDDAAADFYTDVRK